MFIEDQLATLITGKADAIAKLVALADGDDTEHAHVEADDILCALLIQLGHEDVVTKYLAAPKWYA